jgi:GNAT superfamily N-acetyltransferase
MSLCIRFAGPEDADTIYQLVVALADYEREPDAVACSAHDLRGQLASEQPPFECLLAEEDGEARGFALFFHNYSTWRGKRGVYLEDLFVPPQHRGRGIGKRLLVELARITCARGCARLEWAVLDWNTPAIAFYQSLGAKRLEDWMLFRIADAELEALAGDANSR